MSAIPGRRAVIGFLLFTPLAAAPRRLVSKEPKRHEVEITDFRFVPASIDVQPGDQIRWTNRDLAPHTVTADDRSYTSGALAKGASWTLTVDDTATGSYFCTFHPRMKASFRIV